MFFGGGGGGFPFEGMHGGPPGARGRGKNVDTQEYYDLLGVSKEATTNEIRKAYRKLAVKHHPDKGGDEATFKNITEAANVLMDEDKRKVYDTHGKEGIAAGMGENDMDPSDLFGQLFGERGRQQQQARKVKAIGRRVEVSLEDLYCGRSFKLPVERNRLCAECDATGCTKKGMNATCDECNGHGVRIIRRQIAPGFTQQMQAECNNCDGTGTAVPEKFKCKACRGQKHATETKTFEVVVEKGMADGDKIVFEGEGHHIPDVLPGDVMVQLSMKKHDVYTRKGNDLLRDFSVSLLEALEPTTKLKLTHLDERVLTISRPEGLVIKPGSVLKVTNEGMVKRENPMYKGDLYLRFVVEFPDSLPERTLETVTKALASYSEPLGSVTQNAMDDVDEEEWECEMETVDISQFGQNRRGRTAYDDEDDSEGEGQGGVQCQQM